MSIRINFRGLKWKLFHFSAFIPPFSKLGMVCKIFKTSGPTFEISASFPPNLRKSPQMSKARNFKDWFRNFCKYHQTFKTGYILTNFRNCRVQFQNLMFSSSLIHVFQFANIIYQNLRNIDNENLLDQHNVENEGLRSCWITS